MPEFEKAEAYSGLPQSSEMECKAAIVQRTAAFIH